jgi:hypothetical protein
MKKSGVVLLCAIWFFSGQMLLSLQAHSDSDTDKVLVDIENLIQSGQWTKAEASLLKFLWNDPYGKDGALAAEMLSRVSVLTHKASRAMEWIETAIQNPDVSETQLERLRSSLETLHRLYVPGHEHRLNHDFQLSGTDLESPRNILVTPNGDLAVLDRYRLLMFSEKETGFYKLAPPSLPLPDGLRSLKLLENDPVVIVDNGFWLDNTLHTFNGPVGLSRIIDAVFTNEDTWILLDRRNTTILVFNADGSFSHTIPGQPPNGDEQLLKHSFHGCWVLSPSSRQIITVSTSPMVIIPFNGPGYNLNEPVSIATDWFGHLYVLNRNKTVTIFSARGVWLKTVNLDPKGDFLRVPTSITIGLNGSIFIADRRHHDIFCYR